MLRSKKGFNRYAWGLVVYNVFVIVWGAVVRATGSGAGCGNAWPVCNGDFTHIPDNIHTFIEIFHRWTSSLDGLLVILLVVWAYLAFSENEPLVRRWAVLSLVFIIIEGLLGASLVRFDWVADDRSPERALVVAVHLVNTFILLGTLTHTAWLSGVGGKPARREKNLAQTLLGGALVSTLIFSAMGAVTALGDTLFPSLSLADGLRADLDPASHFLVQLRVIHPVLAIATAIYIFWVVQSLPERNLGARVARVSKWVLIVMLIQVLAGGLTVVLLAPIAMQIAHLLLADTFWLALLILTFEVRYELGSADQLA